MSSSKERVEGGDGGGVEGKEDKAIGKCINVKYNMLFVDFFSVFVICHLLMFSFTSELWLPRWNGMHTHKLTHSPVFVSFGLMSKRFYLRMYSVGKLYCQ